VSLPCYRNGVGRRQRLPRAHVAARGAGPQALALSRGRSGAASRRPRTPSPTQPERTPFGAPSRATLRGRSNLDSPGCRLRSRGALLPGSVPDERWHGAASRWIPLAPRGNNLRPPRRQPIAPGLLSWDLPERAPFGALRRATRSWPQCSSGQRPLACETRAVEAKLRAAGAARQLQRVRRGAMSDPATDLLTLESLKAVRRRAAALVSIP